MVEDHYKKAQHLAKSAPWCPFDRALSIAFDQNPKRRTAFHKGGLSFYQAHDIQMVKSLFVVIATQ